MPAGCEFICKNEACGNFKKGFVLDSMWPIGNIHLVKEAANVKESEELVALLEKAILDGQTHSCINYPNVSRIPIEGFRVSKWCKKCFCVWKYDIFPDNIESNREDILNSAVEKGLIASVCQRCGEETITFEKTVEEGLDCPLCGLKLSQQRWFSNEIFEQK